MQPSGTLLTLLAVALLATATQATTVDVSAFISGPQGPLQRYLAVRTGASQFNLTITTRFSGPAQDAYIAGLADFNLADIPLEDGRLQRAGRPIVQFPVYAGGVQFHHSVPGLSGKLRLSACTLARIYSGRITTWDHPEIRKTNKGLKVPKGQRIYTFARNDFSNFTTLATEYFSKGCPKSWTMGVAQNMTWPAPVMGVAGNALVGSILNTTYGIVYLDLTTVLPAALADSAVEIENPAGKFVSASSGDFSRAGFSYAALPGPLESWERISLVWEQLPAKNPKRRVPPGNARQYPIAFLAFFLADEDMVAKGAAGVAIKEYAFFNLGGFVQDPALLKTWGWRPLPQRFEAAALRAASRLRVQQPIALPNAYV